MPSWRPCPSALTIIATREASVLTLLRRAAFQFGVKMTDGRKTRRNQQREKEGKSEKTEKQRDAKLSSELKKISGIMEQNTYVLEQSRLQLNFLRRKNPKRPRVDLPADS